jgi:hypothetical protein
MQRPQFEQSRVLVIYSDMRNNMSELNLESSPLLARHRVINQYLLYVSRLRRVYVYVRGADAAEKSIEYWQALHEFWTSYFDSIGATVCNYSAFRDVVPLAP